MRFATGMSDHLTMLQAYNQFDNLSGPAKFDFCRENFLGIRTLQVGRGVAPPRPHTRAWECFRSACPRWEVM